MPRVGDLTKCKIYKIVSQNNPELVYYGHTCRSLSQRFASHKAPSNNATSKIIIEKGDAIILLIENYPCDTEDQAIAREAFYIINNPCVNKQIPGRTNRDSSKAYREVHKDKAKQYCETHKDGKKEYDKIRYQKAKLLKSQLLNNETQTIIESLQI